MAASKTVKKKSSATPRAKAPAKPRVAAAKPKAVARPKKGTVNNPTALTQGLVFLFTVLCITFAAVAFVAY